MGTRPQTLLFALLAAAAFMNLAAGARRVPIERQKLREGYYLAADQAAAAVRRFVPPADRLAVIVYPGDMVGDVHGDQWFDQRIKWLLYPRPVDLYHADLAGNVTPHPVFPYLHAPRGTAPDPFTRRSHALFFRASGPPVLPREKGELVAAGEGFALTRPVEP